MSSVLRVKDGTVVHHKQISPKMGMNPLLSFTGRQKLFLGVKVVNLKKKICHAKEVIGYPGSRFRLFWTGCQG